MNKKELKFNNMQSEIFTLTFNILLIFSLFAEPLKDFIGILLIVSTGRAIINLIILKLELI